MATVILLTTATVITTSVITGITIARITGRIFEITTVLTGVIHTAGNDITIAAMIVTGIIRGHASIASGAEMLQSDMPGL